MTETVFKEFVMPLSSMSGQTRKSFSTTDLISAPKAKKHSSDEEEAPVMVTKRPRTAEDFYLFCKFILEYENYEQEEICDKSGSPLGSTGSVIESIKSESPASNVPENRKVSETVKAASSQDWNWNGIHFSEEDSYDLVTCYCTKPFAGRPMIECSKCLTWIHLSCAKIKKTNIPEVFICVKCKNRKMNNVSSSSSHKHKKRVSV